MKSTHGVLYGGREVEIDSYGFVDYGSRVLTMTIDDGSEYLFSGADVLRRLPAEDQAHAAGNWRLEGQVCERWTDLPAGIAASLRLQIAEPVESTWDDVDGERLRRYTFQIEPRRNHADTLVAGMYEHLNRLRAAQFFVDLWLTKDDELYAAREQTIMARWAQNPGSSAKVTAVSWDFGVTTGISVPEDARIARSSNASKYFHHVMDPAFLRARG